MGSAKSDSKARQRFRQRLESWGMHPDEIRMCIAEVGKRQQLKREGRLSQDAPLCTRPVYVDLAKRKHLGLIDTKTEEWEPPDDTGYKPTYVDPLLRGAARATGTTAKAVKRGTSFSQYDYDKESK